ncbi:helicase [Hafnia alvei]|uniref:DEAD/DEAH box helicase n=1 Tax=Hafnia alvei TaxID=569 RepID=UPI000DAAFBEE|nr:DEAD/DEAH box helicase [Hafnia alvei]AWV45620.1 helicase [Hafnia alvei]
MPSVSYDRTQVAHWLGHATLAKARDYSRAVSQLHWQGNMLTAKVQGTERRPYAVVIYFHDKQNQLRIEGECSCPVGFNCKHVAAVLLAGLEEQEPTATGARPELLRWLEAFRAQQTSSIAAKKPTQTLAYVLAWSEHRQHHEIRLYKAKLDKDGAVRSIDQQWHNIEPALVKPPKFVTPEDFQILRELWIERPRNGIAAFELQGTSGAELIRKMMATGRFFVIDSNEPLYLGEQRPGEVQWQRLPDHRLRPILQVQPQASWVLPTTPPWYIDTQSGEAGTVELNQPFAQLDEFLSMPPISLSEAPLVAAVLGEVAPELPLPPSMSSSELRVIDVEPVPVLQLDTQNVYMGGFGNYGYRNWPLDFATFSFDYDGISVDPKQDTTLFPADNGNVIQIQRRSDIEKQRAKELKNCGLELITLSDKTRPPTLPDTIYGLPNPESWPSFVSHTLPTLENKGWRIVMTHDSNFNIIEINDISGSIQSSDEGWFDVEMGILVGDRTVRLEPLLADLFRRDRRWLDGELETIDDDEGIILSTEQGERLRIAANRLKPVVRVLVDLFAQLGHGKETLKVSALDAGRLAALSDTGRWQFHGETSIQALAQRLQDGPGVQLVAVPTGLQATLRGYQHQGLSWMQFLREQNISGVLADDMGLGKTVQTLAHILLEKESGRLDRPALIVVPTTLVHNWREEAARFTPDLNVLVLSGPQRKDHFDRIEQCDLILTTYSLLWRDQKVLTQHDYHLLILDEAQYVKNATTRAATALRDLNARHRLCLTGTPLENHLGEIWSLFDFLLPGFLGSQKEFNQRWRVPIERDGDTVRRDLLVRRIRPFMLRRRKDDVATELPPKTTLLRTVELKGSQRDLYETVRTAMQEKVRTAIDSQGMARSHIIVLDALLKLRQVCCDPRLVNLEKAALVKESAKLELLLELLPEMIDEGRRILLFSQFTGMLDLISQALDKAGIAYVTLTGSTADRHAPVQRFQRGEVPLFLISLKAGGVGLNLTAADTVIHYDPWWNPAAENQATDRAHRMGQDKPVFVYKLIAAGSIEEKIVALQDKKAALADSILSEDTSGSAKFSADDLSALFEPID